MATTSLLTTASPAPVPRSLDEAPEVEFLSQFVCDSCNMDARAGVQVSESAWCLSCAEHVGLRPSRALKALDELGKAERVLEHAHDDYDKADPKTDDLQYLAEHIVRAELRLKDARREVAKVEAGI